MALDRAAPLPAHRSHPGISMCANCFRGLDNGAIVDPPPPPPPGATAAALHQMALDCQCKYLTRFRTLGHAHAAGKCEQESF